MQPVKLLTKAGIQFVHKGHQHILQQPLYLTTLIAAGRPTDSAIFCNGSLKLCSIDELMLEATSLPDSRYTAPVFRSVSGFRELGYQPDFAASRASHHQTIF